MLIIDTKHCLRCAGCIGLCPEQALSLSLISLRVDQDMCSDCGICVRFCPVLAISLGEKEKPSRGGRL